MSDQPRLLWLGEVITGTHLQRRYEGVDEVSPVYVGPETLFTAAMEQAGAQALEYGYHSVVVQGQMFVHLWGMWLGWWTQ